MGALVLDREPDNDECESDEDQEEDTRHSHASQPPTVGQTPPILPFIVGGPAGNLHPQIPLRGRGRAFRIGYAGRGMNRGGPGPGPGPGGNV